MHSNECALQLCAHTPTDALQSHTHLLQLLACHIQACASYKHWLWPLLNVRRLHTLMCITHTQRKAQCNVLTPTQAMFITVPNGFL